MTMTIRRTILQAALVGSMATAANAKTVPLDPHAWPVIATIDPRYQSYNIEMVSIMGGTWWAPYAQIDTTTSNSAAAGPATASGIGAAAFSHHPPLDLANPRLRQLAAGLAPAYLRVSDKWANSTFFQDDHAPAAKPPAGFDSVLTASQWRGVLAFSKAMDAKVLLTFAISPGVRAADGTWTPKEAAKILRFTKAAGTTIAAAEFFNEPNLAVIEGAPKGYNASDYSRDFKVFRAFLHQQSPQTQIFGPGSVGELRGFDTLPGAIKSQDMLQAGPLDGVSYHFYGAFSQRCASMGAKLLVSPAAALSQGWLTASRADTAFYRDLRDRYQPGRPLWLSETSQAACGGDRWATQFVDTFRYLNQLGLLAHNGVSVAMHNTLIGSDYGLIDERTYQPRPNYWGALLWRRLIGTKVLDSGATKAPNLYLHAFDLRGVPGGVAILAINADRTGTASLDIKGPFRRFTMTATSLDSGQVLLNGHPLRLDAKGRLPQITGKPGTGVAALPPASITFFAVPPTQHRRGA